MNSMSLLTPTSNLMSNIMANSRQPAPVVGMGATILMFSDRHAATIVEIVSEREIIIQRDNAKRTDKLGFTDSGQEYEYTANPSAGRDSYTLRRNGRWVRKGVSMNGGGAILLGSREEFYDFTR